MSENGSTIFKFKVYSLKFKVVLKLRVLSFKVYSSLKFKVQSSKFKVYNKFQP